MLTEAADAMDKHAYFGNGWIFCTIDCESMIFDYLSDVLCAVFEIRSHINGKKDVVIES